METKIEANNEKIEVIRKNVDQLGQDENRSWRN
jgi:hypothetical protein